MSDAADALIVAVVSILGSLVTFNVGIRQVRRSVTLRCWSNSGPRGRGLSSTLPTRGSRSRRRLFVFHSHREAEARKFRSDPCMPVETTTKGMANDHPLGPNWLRLRVQRRMTLPDLALAGEAA